MKKIQSLERILYIRTDKIGDTLMNIPALRLLRQTYPKSWITLLCDVGVAGLFQGHPDIDEVMAVDASSLKLDKNARRELLRRIKSARFGLAVISTSDKFFHWASFIAGIPHRAGWRRKWGFFLNHSLKDDKKSDVSHEIDSNLRLVELVSDLKWDGSMPLAVAPETKAKIEDFLYRSAPHQAVIAMHIGTTNPKKRWPAERFSELSDRIQSENGPRIVLVGGLDERLTAAEISRRTRLPLVDATGLFSLAELAAFLGSPKVKALISADSGPAHIAWMQGTPTVVFFAKDLPGSNPSRWGPRDGKSEIIEKKVSEISADEAFGALERVLSK